MSAQRSELLANDHKLEVRKVWE